MRSKRRMYKKTKRLTRRSRKNKRGGGFFDFFKGSSSTVVPASCDPNNLSQLKTSEQLRENYQTCCPKTFFGMRKNSSPYCKQVELNANAATEREGMEKEFVAADLEPLEVAEMKNAPMVAPGPLPNPADVAPPMDMGLAPGPLPNPGDVAPPMDMEPKIEANQVTFSGGRRRRRTRRRKTRKTRKTRRHRR